MGGKCNKPRYAYIENKPGSLIGDGLVGSVQQSIRIKSTPNDISTFS